MQEAKGNEGIEPLLSVEDLAKVLRVPRSWVYSATRTKRIPVVKVGKYSRFRLEAVLAALEGQGS